MIPLLLRQIRSRGHNQYIVPITKLMSNTQTHACESVIPAVCVCVCVCVCVSSWHLSAHVSV